MSLLCLHAVCNKDNRQFNCGFSDWKHPKRMRDHKNSREYWDCVLALLPTAGLWMLTAGGRVLVILFEWSERSLPFCGDDEYLGSPHSGNFLGSFTLFLLNTGIDMDIRAGAARPICHPPCATTWYFPFKIRYFKVLVKLTCAVSIIFITRGGVEERGRKKEVKERQTDAPLESPGVTKRAPGDRKGGKNQCESVCFWIMEDVHRILQTVIIGGETLWDSMPWGICILNTALLPDHRPGPDPVHVEGIKTRFMERKTSKPQVLEVVLEEELWWQRETFTVDN